MIENNLAVEKSQLPVHNLVVGKSKAERRVPVQKRAKEKYEAVLNACTIVLAREGYNGTTTSNIAEEAGVAIGALYEYFPNKESIFSAFLESSIDGMMTSIIADAPIEQGMDTTETIRSLLKVAVIASQKNRKMLRVLVNEVPGVLDLPNLKDFEARWSELARYFAKAGNLSLTDKEIEMKIYILVNALYGFFIRSFFSSVEPPAEEVTEELLKLIVSYAEQK